MDALCDGRGFAENCELRAQFSDGRCLMHSSDQAKCPSEFWDAIREQLRKGNRDFRGFVFPADASFQGDTFSELTQFNGATFSANADFQRATFKADVFFDRVTFAADANFTEAKFGRRVSFFATRLFGASDFRRAVFASRAEFSHVVSGPDTQIYLADTDLERSRISHCQVGRWSFSQAYNLARADIDAVDWRSQRRDGKPMAGGRSRTFDERIARGLIVRASPDQPAITFSDAERVYRELRKNYEERNDHPRANDFYEGEMEMRRLAQWQDRGWPGRGWSLTTWYWLLSRYGLSVGRPLSCLGVIWLIGALLYAFAGLALKAVPPSQVTAGSTLPALEWVLSDASGAWLVYGPPELVGIALLHSGLVVTLIGKDLVALPISPWGALVQLIQSMLGPLFIGLAALAVQRKFRR